MGIEITEELKNHPLYKYYELPIKPVPEDVAVVGFKNIPLSQILDLTTINVPKEYLGQLAAARLFERIRDPKIPVVKLCVETQLIDRYSC